MIDFRAVQPSNAPRGGDAADTGERGSTGAYGRGDRTPRFKIGLVTFMMLLRVARVTPPA